MRYVLYQRATSPTCIVGSIHAEGIVQASNTARAMYGSFTVVPWWTASQVERSMAIRMDALADKRAAMVPS